MATTIDECIRAAREAARAQPSGSSYNHTQLVAEMAARMAAAHERRQARRKSEADQATIGALRRTLAEQEELLVAQERISAGLAEELERVRVRDERGEAVEAEDGTGFGALTIGVPGAVTITTPEEWKECFGTKCPPWAEGVLERAKISGPVHCIPLHAPDPGAEPALPDASDPRANSLEEARCEATYSGGIQCIRPSGHSGVHAATVFSCGRDMQWPPDPPSPRFMPGDRVMMRGSIGVTGTVDKIDAWPSADPHVHVIADDGGPTWETRASNLERIHIPESTPPGVMPGED